jgi:hypothetical protein
LSEADDNDRRGSKRHQNPIGQEALGRVMVAVTMFVNHVGSSSKTDPFGRLGPAETSV